jgi:hypothetical protein
MRWKIILAKFLKRGIEFWDRSIMVKEFVEEFAELAMFRSFTLRGKSKTTGNYQAPFLARRPEDGLGIFRICFPALSPDGGL